mgnify:CR=1 FL=1
MFFRLRQAILQNLGIKITSLVLALAVYAHVFSKEERVMVLACPLVVQDLPNGLTFQDDVPSEVRVRVRARGGDLLRLRGNMPQVVVHLKDARPGLLQRPITAEDVVFPSGFHAQADGLVEHTILSLEIERSRRKTLPIRAALEGTPAPGLVIAGRPRLWPDTVTVRGAESLLKGVDTLRTEEIQMNGRTTAMDEVVEVKVPAGLRPDRVTARVRIDLARRPATRSG